MPETQGTKPEGFVPKHPLARCWECDLYTSGKFVPSSGPEKAALAVCGEAPGANEAKVGKPFIGDSGKLLNTVLKHYKIDRSGVLLTNAASCRDEQGSTPSSKVLQACRPRLLAELRGREVKDVVTLGNGATQSLLRSQVGITKLRVGAGRTNEEDLPEVRIIPTFHPAAALRAPDYFPSIVNDFGKIKGFFTSWYEPKWKAYETVEDALAALEELKKIPGEVVLDVETDVEKDETFEDPARHHLLCVGLGFAPGRVAVIGEIPCQDPRVLKSMEEYLIGRPLVEQNGKFDNKVLWAHLGHKTYILGFDTMLASYCRDERGGIHGLEYQAMEMLGAPDWKHEMSRYRRPSQSYGVIPRDILYLYNARDVHATALLKAVHVKAMDAEPVPTFNGVYTPHTLRWLHDFLCRASDQLMFIELNGIGLDVKYNDELAQEYSISLAKKELEIVDAIPGRNTFNPRSPMQVKDVVKNVFGLPLPRKLNAKKEYAETTDAEALEALMYRSKGTVAEPFFAAMLEHRKESKLYGTYVKGVRRRLYRGRVQSTYLLHRTSTGRLSSRNPNLQNIPRGSKMRKQFVVTKPENVFVQGDYAQAELRILCWLAQDDFFRDIFNDPNRDLFQEFMNRLYGEDIVSQLNKADNKELRIRVKAFVYGIAYGREAGSISQEFGIPLAEAERSMREFFSVIPQTVKWRNDVHRTVLGGEDLISPFGRHRRFWLVTKHNRVDVMNEALAFLPQSTASDCCLDGFTTVRPELRGIAIPRNIVHDSIMVECHESRVDEVAALLRKHMLEAAYRVTGDYVKFAVDIEVGKSWGTLVDIDKWKEDQQLAA